MKKKVTIVGTVGLPAQYGGFETLVEQMVIHLAKSFDFQVFCSSKAYSSHPPEYLSAKLSYINFSANGIGSIPYDIASLIKCIREPRVVLILGVSGCLFLPFFKLFSTNKVIVNIDGIEWRRQKWNKLAKFFLRLSEWSAVRYADHVITDNAAIQKYVAEQYNKESLLIEYGGDHAHMIPSGLPLSAKALLPNDVSFDDDFALTVCRIEPENNVSMILEAFDTPDQIPLIFIGNWQKSQYGRDLVNKYASSDTIRLVDPIYDLEILNWLRANCAIYLHGHSAGGTNPSLVEAMWSAAPVICFDVNFNRETTENSGVYFSNSEELKGKIRSLTKSDRLKLKNTLYEIARRRYGWQSICEKYQDIF